METLENELEKRLKVVEKINKKKIQFDAILVGVVVIWLALVFAS